MYWEYLGLPGSALSPGVESLAQWVQWAISGVTRGTSETNWSAVPWYDWVISPAYALLTAPPNETEIRYNLSQFWAQKDAVLASAASEDERRQVYRLDMLAHGTLNAVDDGLLFTASPAYWGFWRAYLVGGNAPRDTVGYEAEAKQAASDAATAARQAGLTDLGTYFDQESSSGVDQVVAAANGFWSQSGVLNVAGVPWWAWGLGSLALFFVVKKWL